MQAAMLLLHISVRVRVLVLLAAMAGMHAAAVAPAPSTDSEGDESALLDFKAKVSSGLLASWSRNSSGGYCGWEGVACGRKHPKRVVALDLPSRGLDGTISPAIGNLTFLRRLNLSFNALHGEVPPSIGFLGRLRYLHLRGNLLRGTIPSNISRCTSLREMLIADNQIRGSIPAEIGTMPMLSLLGLYNNSITGAIPASIGNLSRLEFLLLHLNHLEGPIPQGIGSKPHLLSLSLSSNNLSGVLPPTLYNLSSLQILGVALNQLHGRLPQDFGRGIRGLQKLYLGANRFTGLFPVFLANTSSLQLFDIGLNQFKGLVPSTLSRLQSLEWFSLNDNEFEAKNEQEWEFLTSLTNCSRLRLLGLAANRFAGNLPASFANLSTSLQILQIYSNSISGVIPPAIGNLVGLKQLDLGQNNLSGSIPQSIGDLAQLEILYLDFNNLSASIPLSIGNLTGLLGLIIKSNSLEGPIPSSIGNLEQLSYLYLADNFLTGAIPAETGNLSSLSMLLDLSYNLLEGPVPSQIGNLAHLGTLTLSGNQLSGTIPYTLSNCIVLQVLQLDNNLLQGNIPPVLKNIQGLTILNLTSNKLNGSIPGDLGRITNLQELYLAHNNLSGAIPEKLGNSTSLVHLDLSFNSLQGQVPTYGVFKNLTGLSIVGNRDLCGGIPQLHLPKCPNSTARKNKEMPMSRRIALSTVGAILVSLSVFALAAVFLHRRSKAVVKNGQGLASFTDMELPVVSYNEILKGTDGFSEDNLIRKGRHGLVYRGTIENIHVPVAIKVFNLQQTGSYKSFQVECEALRRVKHRCLVKIITCCSSINHNGQDFRALVFEYMPNGNLDSWIHSTIENQSRNGTLTLEQRLDIAVDIMDALDYLHNSCQPSIIHCDLKPSNILLTQDMRARVGDFGISKILNEAASRNSLNSNSTIGIRGSIGYVAPEYGEGLEVSTYGDVYSLGIILIEMFTGRRPTEGMFEDGLSLHHFAEAALPDKTMIIADSKIWLHEEPNYSEDTGEITKTEECLSAIIRLGVLCSKQSPRDRLSISDAAAEMHHIRDTYLSIRG